MLMLLSSAWAETVNKLLTPGLESPVKYYFHNLKVMKTWTMKYPSKKNTLLWENPRLGSVTDMPNMLFTNVTNVV